MEMHTEQLNIEKLLKEERIYHTFCAVSDAIGDDMICPSLRSDGYFEIGMVADGSGVHCIEGKLIPCKVGDIYIVPPHVAHGYFLADPDESMVVRKLAFYLNDWFKGDALTVGNKRYCYGVFNDGSSVAYAMLNSRMYERINAGMDAIECELLDKEDEWQTVIRTHLIQIFTFIGRYINRSEKNTHGSVKDINLVSSALEMIDAEFNDCELSLDTIAKRVFVSPSHLSRVFKMQSGQLFSEYLREVRLNYAAKLLKESDMTVDKIVLSCGFRDISAFYRNFREAFDMTPQIYRQIEKMSAEKVDNKIINKKESEREMSILNDISVNVQNGKAKIVKEIVQQALDAGVSPAEILDQGLLAGMGIIGEKFKNNQIYVPEVLVAARAMNMGAQILKPHLAQQGVVAAGRVCIGTVQGDLHDIGKNLVKMMMEGKGLEVVDLGTDVAPETFVQTAIEQNCQVICCSALLTTTMGVMADVVKAAEAAGIRDRVKIMVGGAPVSEDFCRKIGADCYTVDAASAADAAVAFCKA